MAHRPGRSKGLVKKGAGACCRSDDSPASLVCPVPKNRSYVNSILGAGPSAVFLTARIFLGTCVNSLAGLQRLVMHVIHHLTCCHGCHPPLHLRTPSLCERSSGLCEWERTLTHSAGISNAAINSSTDMYSLSDRVTRCRGDSTFLVTQQLRVGLGGVAVV